MVSGQQKEERERESTDSTRRLERKKATDIRHIFFFFSRAAINLWAIKTSKNSRLWKYWYTHTHTRRGREGYTRRCVRIKSFGKWKEIWKMLKCGLFRDRLLWICLDLIRLAFNKKKKKILRVYILEDVFLLLVAIFQKNKTNCVAQFCI